MVQACAPWAAQAALAEHHLPRMPGEIKLVLLHCAWGDDLSEIANCVNVSESTAKVRLNHALSEIFETIAEPVRRDGYAASTWVSAHLECCLVDEVAQLRAEADQ